MLDKLDNPDAVTLEDIIENADSDFQEWLKDRRNRRAIPHRMEACGYESVRNNDAKSDGRWKVAGQRRVIYAKKSLPLKDQIAAAKKLIEGRDTDEFFRRREK